MAIVFDVLWLKIKEREASEESLALKSIKKERDEEVSLYNLTLDEGAWTAKRAAKKARKDGTEERDAGRKKGGDCDINEIGSSRVCTYDTLYGRQKNTGKTT